jgi:hypothetical protein
LSPPPSVATHVAPRASSRNAITELKLRLDASPATERNRRIALPFCSEMFTPPAKVPSQSVPD